MRPDATRRRLMGITAVVALVATAAGGCQPRGEDAELRPRILTESLPPELPTREYHAIVVSESVDEIARITFGPSGARVEKVAPVGMSLIDPDGPHGVALAPDGQHYFVSTAHGLPGGSLWKFRSSDDEPVGRAMLGPFPATAQVSPDGYYVWVVNFNLHGDMVTSSVSVVEARSGDLQHLVGERGEVLDALQELTRLAAARDTGERSRLMLDIAGARAARRVALVGLATAAMAEAKRTAGPVALEPMNPFERKVVHDAVAEAGMVSESEGEEPRRRVVIRTH